MMANITDHYIKYLGSISQGWSVDISSAKYKIMEHGGQSSDDYVYYTTEGISSISLMGKTKEMRMEFVMACHNKYKDRNYYVSVLTSLVEYIHQTQKPILRGEVLKFDRSNVDGSDVYLYAAMPVCFPDKFATISLYYAVDIVVCWVFPIYDNEAEYVYVNGWGVFEDKLEMHAPDLMNPKRPSVIDLIL